MTGQRVMVARASRGRMVSYEYQDCMSGVWNADDHGVRR